MLATVDPSVQATSDALTAFISNNSAVLFLLTISVAALAWGLRFLTRKVRHIG